MARIRLCPGSHSLEAQVPAEEKKSSSAAERGTLIHAALAAKFLRAPEPEGLDDDHRETLENISKDIDDIFRQATGYLEDQGISIVGGLNFCSALKAADHGEFAIAVEERYWGQTPTGKRFSGQFDVAAYCLPQRWAVIVDAKSGWNRRISPAESNDQLKTLASIVGAKAAKAGCQLDHIIVALTHPHVGPPSLAVYNASSLAAATREIWAIVDSAHQKNAPRKKHPDACRWCAAKHLCPEALTTMESLAAGNYEANLDSALMDCEVAKQVIAHLEDRAKDLLAKDPTALASWELSKESSVRSIKDSLKAWQAIKDIVPANDFLRACKPGIDALTKIVKEKEKSTVAQAEKILATRLGEIIETKPKARSLQRK